MLNGAAISRRFTRQPTVAHSDSKLNSADMLTKASMFPDVFADFRRSSIMGYLS